MRKKLLLLFFSFLLCGIVSQSSRAHAILIRPPIRTYPTPQQPFFGQYHTYSVTFRGNGEAVVTFKGVLYNSDPQPLSIQSIYFPPDVNPQDIVIFQVVQEPQCIQYKPLPLGTAQPTVPIQSGNDTADNINPDCAEYQDPDYQYISSNAQYQKVSFDWKQNMLTMYLPTPIQQNKYGSYFMYYRSFAYAQKNMFGAYDFSFQTPKFNDRINSLQIGITTDADLFLRGAEGKVNYETIKSAALPAIQVGGAPIKNPRLDAFYNQIGQGTIVKTASDLQPLESYTAKGVYADNGIKLYGKEIGTTIGIILAIVLIITIVIKILLKRKIFHKSEKIGGLSTTSKRLLITGGVSFVSGLFICGYTILIFAIISFFSTPFTYYQYNLFLFLFITGISFIVYIFLLIIPSIIIGMKTNFVWGGVTAGLTVLWVMIFSAITFVIVYFLFPNTRYFPPPPIIQPFMGAGVKSSTVPQSSTQ